MTRKLKGDTLLVFLSDCHIGGDDDRDIFESPDDLAALFDSIHGHSGPVELVLAGDFFDFLRIEEVPEGQNRASATMARPEYRELFAALRRFAAGQDRTVVYLPGNHDAEAWWNREIHAELERAGLVHEFALSYCASFEPEADRIVYCEHGNQFDPTNTFRDYYDPLDTPLGDHIVTDFVRRLPRGWEAEGGNLRDIARVFPLTAIPEWLAGRTYYYLRRTDEPELIRSRLETGQPLPLGGAPTAEVAVFVSGHTHAPALTHFDAPTGRRGALVNSGCWLRQLQPVPTSLGVPPVFVSQFVQTHVRVYWDNGAIQVELWEHPRPSTRRLRVAERLAVVGRLPAEPDAEASPRVRARTSVGST